MCKGNNILNCNIQAEAILVINLILLMNTFKNNYKYLYAGQTKFKYVFDKLEAH